MKYVLTIAGFDPSLGAGIGRDILTISSIGCSPLSLITSLTVQSAKRIRLYKTVSSMLFLKQLAELVEEITPDAVKIGMLGNSGMVEAVASGIKKFKLKNVVLDTILESSSGYPLIDAKGFRLLKKKLIPLATIITPNIPEAQKLSGEKIKNVEDMEKAAKALKNIGAKSVLVKGGHFSGDPIDVFYDGEKILRFRSKRLDPEWSHGTGCVLSSAIASFLAKNGGDVTEAVRSALGYMRKSLLFKYNGDKSSLKSPIDKYTKDRLESLDRMSKAVAVLRGHDISRLVPEVGCNIVECLKDGNEHEDVVGLSGRILKSREGVLYNCRPEFGASRHVATIALTAKRFDKNVKAAMNLKFSDDAIRVCRKLGFTIGEFSRDLEPGEKMNGKVSTMEWGTKWVIDRLGAVPDIIFDRGSLGKEPMIRVLGTDCLEVAQKVIKILGGLNDSA